MLHPVAGTLTSQRYSLPSIDHIFKSPNISVQVFTSPPHFFVPKKWNVGLQVGVFPGKNGIYLFSHPVDTHLSNQARCSHAEGFAGAFPAQQDEQPCLGEARDLVGVT